MAALDLDFFEFLILDLDIFAFPDFIAARDVFLVDRLLGFGIDEKLLQAVAGLPVEAVKRDLFAGRGGRIQAQSGMTPARV